MTTENLKAALEYAVELKQYGLEILTAADGTEYYDANKFNLKELDPKRYPRTLELSTLTSLVDYLTGSKTYKEGKADTVVWFIFDAYAIALIYTVIKILEG